MWPAPVVMCDPLLEKAPQVALVEREQKNKAFAANRADQSLTERVDFLIPLNERHLRSLLKEWVTHYNRGRPHASLGPGIPDLRSGQQQARLCGHRIPIDHQVVAKAILGGLHHEYSLERRAA